MANGNGNGFRDEVDKGVSPEPIPSNHHVSIPKDLVNMHYQTKYLAKGQSERLIRAIRCLDWQVVESTSESQKRTIEALSALTPQERCTLTTLLENGGEPVQELLGGFYTNRLPAHSDEFAYLLTRVVEDDGTPDMAEETCIILNYLSPEELAKFSSRVANLVGLRNAVNVMGAYFVPQSDEQRILIYEMFRKEIVERADPRFVEHSNLADFMLSRGLLNLQTIDFSENLSLGFAKAEAKRLEESYLNWRRIHRA